MKVLASTLWGIFFISLVFANTEKVIFSVKNEHMSNLECAELQDLSSRELSPPFTEIRDVIVPNVQQKKYKLNNLQEESTYEVRLSYPAITPADFDMKILSHCKAKNNSRVYLLSIGAKATGISPIKGIEKDAITFNLALEPLYIGFLFYNVYKIVIAIIIVLGLGLFIVIPRVKHFIKAKNPQKDK
ncbi:unnamed protein product [Rhizopus stolonifer]